MHARVTAENDLERSAEQLLAVIDALLAETSRGTARRASLDASLERQLGLDSLGRVELLLRIERSFGVSMPEQALSTAETPRDLLRLLRSSLGAPRERVDREIESLAQAADSGEPETASTLPEALDWQVARHPDRLHMLLLGDTGEERFSYRAIRDGAAGYAARLRASGIEPGQAVAIMLPTGREYLFSFFGVLMAGAIPVPLYPPARLSQIEDHMRRHTGILQNCRAAALITVPEARALALLLRSSIASLQRVFEPAELAEGTARDFSPHAAKPGDIAFLQYTSGSTGNPKGVVLTHENLLANLRAMGRAVKAGPEDVFVSWLPLYHDMGLIGAWFAPMYFGFAGVLMSPLAMLARPSRWLWAIHRHRGTISGGPNFAFELCMKRIQDSELEGLDLSSWRFAFNGAEPVSPETLDAFYKRFAPYGLARGALAPVYGLAETCVGLAFTLPGRGWQIDAIEREAFVRSGEARPAAADDPHAIKVPCCGEPLADHDLRVVDESGIDLPERHEGRLQFRGPSATSGYYRNPEATQRLFAGNWLDTGDLAYLAAGELYLTGRSKDVIIRAGRNFFPYELEQAVGALEGIRKGCVAAFGARDAAGGTERIVVLAETRETDEATRERLRARINELSVDLIGAPADDIMLAPPHTVLKTSSGKIRRGACREFYERGGKAVHPAPVWWQLARLVWSAIVPQTRQALRSATTYAYNLWVWLAFGGVGLIAFALIALGRRPAWGWGVTKVAMRTVLALARISVVVKGLETYDRSKPGVVVANHASYLDGPLLVAVLPWNDGAFVAKRELREHFITRAALEGVGAAFVERFETEKSVDDAARLAELAERGTSLVVFAEGTFRHRAGLRPFRMGAFAAAARAGVPVVPIAIRGARTVLREGSWFVRRVPISITIGAPIEPSGADWKAALELRDRAREHILKHCGEPDLES
jgi:1-acyl-sn-glycerol-3-phosphate acyltransferase